MSLSPDSAPPAAQQQQQDYSRWSNSSLIARITELERQLNSYNAGTVLSTAAAAQPTSNHTSRASSPSGRQRKKKLKKIDPSKYNTRFIALKFAYLGARYNGLEHTNGNLTPLPTIEEVLWRALRKARLIFPEWPECEDEVGEDGRNILQPYSLDWTGCEYSKCGRTDRGVSAFGQVVGIRVRSTQPKYAAQKKDTSMSPSTGADEASMVAPLGELAISDPEQFEEEEKWDDIRDELPYIQILNNILPEDIRVLAWCPHPPPGFNSRFSCRQRRYRYFFTQPAFSPTPDPRGPVRSEDGRPRQGWLDIEAMREGARNYMGVHDFRNFCKIDPSKQILNYKREIFHADIEILDPKSSPMGYVGEPEFWNPDAKENNENLSSANSSPVQTYSFTLHGSAFLWHQVRHMVAILFLIGQGLESPSIVKELLDVTKNPRKPIYEMASDAPLVLWDCVFPDESSDSREDAIDWIYAGDPRIAKSSLSRGTGKFGHGGIVEDLWSVWRQRKIDEILAATLLDRVVGQGDRSAFLDTNPDVSRHNLKVFFGGIEARFGGKYIPVMQRRRLETVDVINAKYRAKPGKQKGRFNGAARDSGADD
ncbi:tRNA pseudouridine(38-40) synthase [Polytolypa hystricis UAMH7299]|uniref:tRNA pseudouridine(38-40) synthase n=1 Tax=Polytolypa hystricis (strain UAMH7299) TaxID=1447883 RepID=A0A2B7XQ53_POLH7|nr:tRNA pseudouridine(38-40) synthase [Polytolypa hystricis UAMH7299]